MGGYGRFLVVPGLGVEARQVEPAGVPGGIKLLGGFMRGDGRLKVVFGIGLGHESQDISLM